MKKQLFTLAFLLCMQYSFAQTLLTQAKPIDKKEWGYVNEKGEFIIQPQYRKCFAFSSDGYAPILDEKTKKYAFINKNGERLNTEVQDYGLISLFGFGVVGFEEGMVPIKKGSKWGYMNTAGKEAIPATYDKVREFNGGYASAEKGTSFVILDTKGNETPITDSRIVGVKKFSEGLAIFDTKDKKSGCLDHTGKVAIEPNFLSIGYFSNGLAWAKRTDEKVGYINKKGEWVIEPQFDATHNFDAKSGMARVKSGTESFFIDKTGKRLNVEAESIDDFNEGLAIGKKGGKAGFFDNTGNWVIEPKFDAVRPFKNGYAAAKSGEKWGMIDTKGNWTIQPTFDGIKDMERAD